MMKVAQSFDAVAQCRLEPWVARQRRLEAEDFPGWSTCVVEHQETIAETIRVPLRVPSGQATAALDHGNERVDDQIVARSHGASILLRAVPIRRVIDVNREESTTLCTNKRLS
jgi:hypothetical protein